MNVFLKRTDDDYYGVKEYILPVVQAAIKSATYLEILCMILNTYDTYTEHISNDVSKALKLYGNLKKEDMSEAELQNYADFSQKLYDLYWTIVDDEFGKEIFKANQDLCNKHKLKLVENRLGRYRGILFEEVVAAMVEERFQEGDFQKGCKIRIDGTWIRIGYDTGNSKHKETFDVAGWKNDLFYGEFYECKVNPERFTEENYRLFEMLWKELEQHFNIQYILALVSSETKEKVKKHCSVVVIGAGTAGLEAACTAAEVGCTTFLLEKKDVLGGLATEISKIPDKKRLYDFPKYLINRAEKLENLYIFKNTEATVDLVKSLKPSLIINATGSSPLLPPIKGLHDVMAKEDSKVFSILDMINNIDNYPEDLNGKKVVIIGGGAVGLDVAEFFAPRNAECSIVEMAPVIGNRIDPVSKVGTFDLLNKHGVKQLTSTKLLEVKDNSFLVEYADGKLDELEFDYGFVCLGMRSNNPVLEALKEEYSDTNIEVISIGDSVRARRIIEGVEEGRNIINTLTKHDFLDIYV